MSDLPAPQSFDELFEMIFGDDIDKVRPKIIDVKLPVRGFGPVALYGEPGLAE